MLSCEEAAFYLRNCGALRLDGNTTAFRATAFADDKRGDCHVFAVVFGAAERSGDVWGFRASSSRILLSFVTTQLPLRRVRSQSHPRCGKEPYHWEPWSGRCLFRR
jgi:hypothetical protein